MSGRAFFRYLVLSLFFLAVVSAKAEIYTTLDGYQVEITLAPDKPEIMASEPMWFSLEIKNLSDVTIGFVNGGDYRNEFGRPDSFSIEAEDEKGLPAKKIESKFNMGGLSGVVRIPAGEKRLVRFLTSHWIDFERAGIHTISCRKEMVIKKYEPKDTSNFFGRRMISINVKNQITVTPGNSKKMAKVIEAFGRDLFGDSYEKSVESLKALMFIEDERVIKYFVKIIESISGGDKRFFDYRFYVFRPLAKFDNEIAFNAIAGETRSTNDEIRREAALSLSMSKHSKAERHLLSMRTDKSDAIRLDVVHYLGKKKTDESTEVLKTMLSDASEQVKNEAKRYLEERGVKIN